MKKVKKMPKKDKGVLVISVAQKPKSMMPESIKKAAKSKKGYC
jgi:hypothetical protein